MTVHLVALKKGFHSIQKLYRIVLSKSITWVYVIISIIGQVKRDLISCQVTELSTLLNFDLGIGYVRL